MSVCDFFGAMWEANFYKKGIYGLGIIKVFNLKIEMGQLKTFLFSKFFGQFFFDTFLNKFLGALHTMPVKSRGHCPNSSQEVKGEVH